MSQTERRNPKEELKQALYESCNCQFDRDAIIYNILETEAQALAEVFGNDSTRFEEYLGKFYDTETYKDAELDEVHTFAEWTQYYKECWRDEFVQDMFNSLRQGNSLCRAIEEQSVWSEAFQIYIGDGDRDEYTIGRYEYTDGILGVCMTLAEWESFFYNDSYGMYKMLYDMDAENDRLRDQLDAIRNIINK